MTTRNPYHPDGLWPTAGSYTRTAPDPDDMDGGVTAALVEKEAEKHDAAHDIDWQAVAEQHEEALAAMTEDRDHVLDLVRDADMGRDLAMERAVRAEQDRDEARTVTDEMVERLRMHMRRVHYLFIDTGDGAEALRAALTEPPARPEGAEAVQNYLEGFLSGVRFLDDIDPAWLADHLIETLNDSGVRVVTQKGGERPGLGSPTRDCGRGPCCLGDGHDGDCRR